MLLGLLLLPASPCLGQRLTEEAYLQKMADTFSGRTNWLTNIKRSTAENFSYRSRLEYFGDNGEIVTAAILYAGANGTNSYILITDMNGVPFTFLRGNLNLVFNEQNQGQFYLCESGNHQYTLDLREMKRINFEVGYTGTSQYDGGVVTLNFATLFVYAGMTAVSTKFDMPTETMMYQLEGDRTISYSFVKGPFLNGRSPSNPTNIREVKLLSKRMALLVDDFQFDSKLNDRFLKLQVDDLKKGGVDFSLISGDDISKKAIKLTPTKNHVWTAAGKTNADRLRAVLFPK